MPNMKEKSVKERFIRKQLELAKKRLEANEKLENDTEGELLRHYFMGKKDSTKLEIEILEHLLENCAE